MNHVEYPQNWIWFDHEFGETKPTWYIKVVIHLTSASHQQDNQSKNDLLDSEVKPTQLALLAAGKKDTPTVYIWAIYHFKWWWFSKGIPSHNFDLLFVFHSFCKHLVEKQSWHLFSNS